MADSTALHKKIAVLRQKFVDNLAGIIEELEQLMVQLDSAASSNKCTIHVLESILGISHKMAGTAGTFGFSALSDFAKSMELQVIDILDDVEGLNQHNLQALKSVFESIKNDGGKASGRRVIVEPVWETRKEELIPQVGATKKTIVIVDDDEDLLRVLTVQLNQYDFTVIALTDCSQLREVLLSEPVSVVVMDVIFPGDTDAGVNAITTLSDEGILTCPFVFLSVRDDLLARLSAIRAGCAGYFLKPVDLSDLAAVLSRLAETVKEEPYRVVVIDDDPQEAEFHALMLGEAGVVTMTVTDPLESMASIRALSPDVILIDIVMPGCNGFELAKVIRQHNKYLNIPIVFLSNSDVHDDWLKVMLAGGDEFLKKHITPAELVTSVLARAARSRELHRMLNKLSVSENRFRSVAASARDAIITTDIEGRVITWNQGAEQIFGYSEGEILGGAVTSLFSPKDHLLYFSDFKFVELSALKKDGSEFPAEISKSTWVVDDGHYSTNIIRDVSRRKEYEQSLQDAKIIAEKANLAKSKFLSSMSHELRTPLNAIMGFSQLLTFNSKDPLTDAQQDCVEHIISGGRHLLELINDILDLAKIEAGKINLSIEAVSVDPLIEECVELLQSLGDKFQVGVRIKSSFDEVVYADYTRIKQVLLNLLSNAIKYNKPGGDVSIAYEKVLEDKLRISVTDTGIGIKKDKEHELFQPFSRLGAEVTEIEGTGVGLSVSKNLVELMGGCIGMHRADGGGSVFWIELPLTTMLASEGSQRGEPEMAFSTQNLTNVEGTLLYVEDNPANMQLIEAMAATINGLSLITATNAEQGLQLARNTPPDLIILDINLPDMDGFQVLQHLRDSKNTEHIPVLALSASAMPLDVEKGKEAGFLRYLTKPIDIGEVCAVISEFL